MWINVRDKLPSDIKFLTGPLWEGEVLVYMPTMNEFSGKIQVAVFRGGEFQDHCGVPFTGIKGSSLVTHWMPIKPMYESLHKKLKKEKS